jgi:hypothetical protein
MSTFNCFLYVLTALGQNDDKPNWEHCPENFYIYWSFKEDREELIGLMSRYKSLENGVKQLQRSKGNCGLYYGISYSENKVYLEYGIATNGEKLTIGQFKLTDSIMFKLLSKTNKSLVSFIKELKDTTTNNIRLLMKVKKELVDYKPAEFKKKSNIEMHDGILTFGYYGIGKWSGDEFDSEEYESLKRNFKNWLSKRKWSEKILVSVKPLDYWIYFNIKIR